MKKIKESGKFRLLSLYFLDWDFGDYDDWLMKMAMNYELTK